MLQRRSDQSRGSPALALQDVLDLFSPRDAITAWEPFRLGSSLQAPEEKRCEEFQNSSASMLSRWRKLAISVFIAKGTALLGLSVVSHQAPGFGPARSEIRCHGAPEAHRNLPSTLRLHWRLRSRRSTWRCLDAPTVRAFRLQPFPEAHKEGGSPIRPCYGPLRLWWGLFHGPLFCIWYIADTYWCPD